MLGQVAMDEDVVARNLVCSFNPAINNPNARVRKTGPAFVFTARYPARAILDVLPKERYRSFQRRRFLSDLRSHSFQSGQHLFKCLRRALSSTYRRPFAAIFLVNICILLALLARPHLYLTLSTTSLATCANLLVAVLARQEHVINLLFESSCAIPLLTPLRFRRCLAKVYCYGGLHSGCAVAAVAWYLVFSFLTAQNLVNGLLLRPWLPLVTFMNALLLLVILAIAYPKLRSRVHNWFEAIHCFAGWTANVLFWVQTVFMADETRRRD